MEKSVWKKEVKTATKRKNRWWSRVSTIFVCTVCPPIRYSTLHSSLRLHIYISLISHDELDRRPAAAPSHSLRPTDQGPEAEFRQIQTPCKGHGHSPAFPVCQLSRLQGLEHGSRDKQKSVSVELLIALTLLSNTSDIPCTNLVFISLEPLHRSQFRI
jgi:hypothetical protein